MARPPAALLAHYLSLWNLTGATPVAATPRATVWRVETASGSAALKIATGHQKDSEAGATTILTELNGRGAVQCYESDDRAWLLEWIDGPPLGDKSRAGDDPGATAILAKVAARIHETPLRDIRDLPTLETWCTDLTEFDPARAPTLAARHNMAAAQALLSALLSSRTEDRPLHGDLHHDNVALSDRGWLAFDPKGVRGELAFETANAFRNPVGMADAARQPDRIAAMTDAFVDALGTDRSRVLKWAAVKCALSISWGLADGDGPEADWTLLEALLDAAAA